MNRANTKFDHDGISPCFELIQHIMRGVMLTRDLYA